MRIPLFPLDLVLFPGAVVPLHVFETRYKEMIGRCISDDAPFGVALIRGGREVGGPAETVQVGTLARIVQHRLLPDGRYVLLAAGGDRFRIRRRLPDRPFPEAEVEVLAPGPDADVAPGTVDEVRSLALRYVGLAAEAGEIDAATPLDVPDDPESAGFAVSAVLAAGPEVRQRLLELDAGERLRELRVFLAGENLRLEAAILGR